MKNLSEKNFIADKGPLGPSLRPFLISLLFFFLAFLLLAGIVQVMQRNWKQIELAKPFLDVTNREISQFLWQFPSYMRVHVKQKTAYMPGFRYIESQTVDPAQADRFVTAPPEVLFLYHTWKRLLSRYFTPRSIPSEEFIEFLNSDTQWQPTNWPEAPSEYTHFVENLSDHPLNEDLSLLPKTMLPIEVRQAFQGWKNYYKEGDFINEVNPTLEEMRGYLEKYPHYARNYWMNITEVEGVLVAGANYLLVLDEPNHFPTEFIPADQLSGFLKVAYFNFLHENK